MNAITKAQEEMALEYLRKLNIFEPYIEGFIKHNQVCFFESYAGFWINQEPDAYQKMKEIEFLYRCKVYAVTHEYTGFGELYSFLIVTRYRQEWKTLVKSSGDKHRALAYVWNKDDDHYSEFGSIIVRSWGGGIKRIA